MLVRALRLRCVWGYDLRMATTAQALTVNPDQQAILQELAARELRSPETLLREAIDDYIEQALQPASAQTALQDHEYPAPFESDEEAIAHADAAFEHYKRTGLHVTWEEVDQWLAKLQAGENVPPPECHT